MMWDLVVLITGCGSEGAYGVIKSLRMNHEREVRIIGIDTDEIIVNRYMVDKFCVPPGRNDPEFIPFVMDLSRKEAVDVIYPIPTTELEMFAVNRSHFENQGQRVLVSSMESLETANNKAKLFQWMEKNGIPCRPAYRIVHSWDELISAAHDLGYPNQPVCFKPPISTGSKGFRVLDNEVDHLHLLLNGHPTSTFTNLDELKLVLGYAQPFPELIVMEYLLGDEYDVDVLAMNGKPLSVIPRKNHKMWYGMSLICTTEPQVEMMELTEQIVTSLGLSYVVSLSFKMNAEKKIKIMEINPRIPGSIISPTMAGVNMPYLSVKLGLGEGFEIPPVKWGIKMIRYWEEMFLSPEGELLKPISNG